MLSVVTWLWKGNRDYRPEHVNILQSMMSRHCPQMSRFICITDMPGEFSDGVEVMPVPPSARRLESLRTVEGFGFPSCHRRLWVFSEEAQILGERILLTDIDAVVIGDMTRLVEAKGDFVGWNPKLRWGAHPRLAGGFYLLRTGSKTHVWERFTGRDSIIEARLKGYRGSDQAWISYSIGEHNVWGEVDGVYSYRDIRRGLPEFARVVHFNGHKKPWACRERWVVEHYR